MKTRTEVQKMTLVAGGTGGHILPAIAFGEWMKREKPHVQIDYMSGARSVEREIYAAWDIKPNEIGMTGSPIGIKGVRSLRRWAELVKSTFETRRVMKKTSPDACVLFGGYASLPALFVSKARGIYSVLHEQNALAGRVTKLASKLGVKIASGWDNCEGLERSRYTPVGIPTRRMKRLTRESAWETLGFNPRNGEGPVVSVMTGSLGSGHVSNVLSELTKMDSFASWTFLLIDPVIKSLYEAGNVVHVPQMWDISALYSVSDILITRGGASTLAEVKIFGKPAVVLPWRNAAGDHQMKNAIAASCEKILIWNEKSDTLNDLALKLEELRDKCAHENGFGANLLYNSNEACETICRRLWDFVAKNAEGDVFIVR